MTAPPPVIDRAAVDAIALARWAARCAVADRQDARLRRGAVARLDGAGDDEPDGERQPHARA